MAREVPHYAVVCIASDEVIYVGTSVCAAARELVPGTIHRKAESVRGAIQAARRLAERIRLSKRLPKPNLVDKHRTHGRRSGDVPRSMIAERAKSVREDGFLNQRYGPQPPWDVTRWLS